jgi:hypothetical protein
MDEALRSVGITRADAHVLCEYIQTQQPAAVVQRRFVTFYLK